MAVQVNRCSYQPQQAIIDELYLLAPYRYAGQALEESIHTLHIHIIYELGEAPGSHTYHYSRLNGASSYLAA